MDLFLHARDGCRLYARGEGEGDQRAIFIHGFPFDQSMWLPQLASLGDTAIMLAPDLRGLGRSEGPEDSSKYSLEAYARDLAGWMDELRWEGAVFVGLSMGGYIAFEFLRLFPARLTGLILMDTHPYPDSEETREGRRHAQLIVKTGGAESIADSLIEKVLGSYTLASRPEVVTQVRAMMISAPPAGLIGALEAMANRQSSKPLLGDIAVPTLVVVGEEDMITPPDQTMAWAAAIPEAQTVIVPKAGHVVNLEAPEEISRLIRDFLERLSA